MPAATVQRGIPPPFFNLIALLIHAFISDIIIILQLQVQQERIPFSECLSEIAMSKFSHIDVL